MNDTSEIPCNGTIEARKIIVDGKVQGVGFRPFIYRIANDNDLHGWVRNRLGQVEIHIQGTAAAIQRFESTLVEHAPPVSQPSIRSSKTAMIETFDHFSILESEAGGDACISVPADLFTCNECLSEFNDTTDRRYRYPFINCTQCGPRYTLIEKLPYDRANTSMKAFNLCPQCKTEYNNPLDRRYHAEPVACPACGPSLQYKSAGGDIIDRSESALAACIDELHNGKIIAVKGIGGYHLVCDAGNDNAVLKLRSKKPRPDKPLALLFPAPADNMFSSIDSTFDLSQQEKDLLASPARPILLIKKTGNSSISDHVAPGLDELGIMLPYSPLHHLLLNDFGAPLVATSANLSGEPVLIDNDEIETRLGHVPDAFLHHNREILRPADDPVFRTIRNHARPIRLGRGFTPLELTLPFSLDKPVLAIGAHMKNTITLAWDNRAVMSPHIGEMDSARSLRVFEQLIEDLQQLYRIEIDNIVRDAHPGYTTTRWANQQGKPTYKVFHHHAHASSAYYEAAVASKDLADILVFTWDGVGYGDDGTLWGGEALLGHPGQWQRFASLLPFRIPGGERAGREPWRSAAALCWQSGTECPAQPEGSDLLYEAWQKHINTPLTTSAGRLFDAAAALTGLCTQASYEGQAPMLLEAQCTEHAEAVHLPLCQDNELWQTDWQPLLPMLLDTKTSIAQRAACFHASLADAILHQSLLAREHFSISDIGFSGGVFQNRVLTELAAALLEQNGFKVHIPETIPLNDAGISFGQMIEFMYKENR